MREVTIRALQTTDWPVVERLFGTNGACGGCWCMWWRVDKGGKTWEAAKGEPNRTAFRAQVEDGRCRAVLALAGDEPVGWCTFGPRADFPRLLRSRKLNRPAPAPWAITCFFVRAGWRRRGIATDLLRAAADMALAAGAEAVEGYPAVPKSGELPAAFAYTGVPAIFAAAGFEDSGFDGGSRRVFVKAA